MRGYGGAGTFIEKTSPAIRKPSSFHFFYGPNVLKVDVIYVKRKFKDILFIGFS